MVNLLKHYKVLEKDNIQLFEPEMEAKTLYTLCKVLREEIGKHSD